MEHKLRGHRIEDLKKYFTISDPTKEKILNEIQPEFHLTKEKYKKIENNIMERKLEIFIGGLPIVGTIEKIISKDTGKYIVKFHNMKEPVLLIPFFYDCTSFKEGDMFYGKLEYTDLTKKFNLSEFEILIPNEKKIIEIFHENNGNTILERVDYLLKLSGLNPEKLMIREKLNFIIRMIPIVQENYSLMEFSIGGIGKSTFYSNFDTCYRAPSTETSAELFFNKSSNKEGIIAQTEVLVIDELQKSKDKELIGNLQEYIESGKLPRYGGNKTLSTSIVLLGNATLEKGKEYQDLFVWPEENLFKNHSEFNKEFIDRLNFILPSWGTRKIEKDFTTNTSAFFYLQSLFEILRKDSVNLNFLKDKIKDMSVRAANGIKKTTEGLIKLLNLEEEEYDIAFYLAIEGRYIIEKILSMMGYSKKEDLKKFEEFLTNKAYEEVIENFLDDHYKIIEITPHEVYYQKEKKGEIILEALDTIGMEEMHIFKQYSDEDACEDEGTFKLLLENSYNLKDLKKEYEDLSDEIEGKGKKKSLKKVYYQEDEINYLYGYKFSDDVKLFLLRTERYVNKNAKIFCEKCKEKEILDIDNWNLECPECDTEYHFKKYSEELNLKKL